jgi:hypothetical protein
VVVTVARIRISRDVAGLHVDVRGRLQAADLRRLEHACAPALVTDPVRIELRLNHVTHMDRIAAAFVDRMTQRGAVVTRVGGAPRDSRTE